MNNNTVYTILEEWTKDLDSRQSKIKVFENIRNIRYKATSPFSNRRINPQRILNDGKGCSLSKHYLLGLMFEKMEIPVKYISYTFNWNDHDLILPINLKELAGKSSLFYHLNIKALINDKWVLCDASWDSPLAKAGFPVNESWDGVNDTKNAVNPLSETVHENAFDCAKYFEEKWSQLNDEELTSANIFFAQLNKWLKLIRTWDDQSKEPKPEDSSGFSNLTSHQLMIKDKIRTQSYKNAIESSVKSNDIVLDLGCGTGILSFFAAKKGCRKVYAIDKSNIIDCAIETAKRNSLDKHIEFIKSDMFCLELKEKLDVLIHEQIGMFLWDEGIIYKVAYIRDNFLKSNGKIIPFKIELYLVPTNYKSPLEKSMTFWSHKNYEIDFGNLKYKAFKEQADNAFHPQVILLKDTKTFLCEEKLAYTIDLRNESEIPQKITISFNLKRNSKLRGMCAYFKVYLDENNVFSTEPKKRTNTHWGQIFIPCFKKMKLKQDSTLNFTLLPKIKANEWKFKFEIT